MLQPLQEHVLELFLAFNLFPNQKSDLHSRQNGFKLQNCNKDGKRHLKLKCLNVGHLERNIRSSERSDLQRMFCSAIV